MIVVEDDGVGVPHEIRDILFEKGSQGKNSTGFGLGTYLIKNIVTSYQGGITYSDSDLGGARFDIWLNLT